MPEGTARTAADSISAAAYAVADASQGIQTSSFRPSIAPFIDPAKSKHPRFGLLGGRKMADEVPSESVRAGVRVAVAGGFSRPLGVVAMLLQLCFA